MTIKEKLAAAVADLQQIIEALKNFKEHHVEAYNTELVRPRDKRTHMDIFTEMRAKEGRLATYSKLGEEKYKDAIKKDIHQSAKILMLDVDEIKSAPSIDAETKKTCDNVLLQLNVIFAEVSENDVERKPTGP